MSRFGAFYVVVKKSESEEICMKASRETTWGEKQKSMPVLPRWSFHARKSPYALPKRREKAMKNLSLGSKKRESINR